MTMKNVQLTDCWNMS